MLSPMMQCAGRIRVKDCPFGTPDGTSNQFQLTDRHGHAVTRDVRIQSIYQTDWQGRVELSSEARTNLIPDGDLSGPYWGNDHQTIVSPSSLVAPVQLYTLTADGPQTGTVGRAITTSASVGSVVRLTAICGRTGYARLYGLGNGGAGVVFDLGNLTASILSNWEYAEIVELPDGLCAITAIGIATVNGNPYVGVSPDELGSPNYIGGESVDIGAPMLEVCNSVADAKIRRAYIPTTDSPVTVTDYTHDGQGGITTGQVPADGATLDWTGSARRAA